MIIYEKNASFLSLLFKTNNRTLRATILQAIKPHATSGHTPSDSTSLSGTLKRRSPRCVRRATTSRSVRLTLLTLRRAYGHRPIRRVDTTLGSIGGRPRPVRQIDVTFGATGERPRPVRRNDATFGTAGVQQMTSTSS